MNKVKDGNETDVDCGGSCAKCAADKACKTSTDCASHICSGGTCKESCFLEKDTSPIAGGKLEVKQFLLAGSPIHPLALSPSGKLAISAQWGGGSRMYKRDAEGLLSFVDAASYPSDAEGGSRGAGFVSESKVMFSRDCCTKEDLFEVTVNADGTFPLSTTELGTNGHELREVFWLTSKVSLLAAGWGIRKVVNGTYNPNPLVTGNEIWRLSRMGEWLYWTEGFIHDPKFINPGHHKIARAKVDCDGNLGPAQYISFSKPGMAVVGCQDTGRMYVASNDIANPNFEGALSVFDTKECPGELAFCTPQKVVTRQEVPSLGSQPNMMALSPDCSTLYVASLVPGAPDVPTLNVFSLSDPDKPTFVQVIEGGKTYGDVTLGPSAAPWAITATREAVYWTFSFNTGIAVLKPVP